MSVHVFTGPTAVEDAARQEIPGCFIHPPAQHGDFFRHELSQGDVAVLVDGLYHGNPPIRHKEILEKMSCGVVVIGVASMGALRAAELHQFGMIGVGRIFEDYRDGRIEADDEVAVLHAEGPDWKVLSEALVNMRHQLEIAAQAGVVSPAEQDTLLETARALHYPRRSWRAVAQALRSHPDLHKSARRMTEFAAAAGERANLKLLDAHAGLRHARTLCERAETANLAAPPDTNWPDGWRTAYLRRWKYEFTGEVREGRLVSRAAQLDYQRLFGPDQPQRWSRYVLSAMAGLPPDSALQELEDRALAAAAAVELRADRIPQQQAAQWLTGNEHTALSSRQRMLTVLIRSSRITADLNDVRTAGWLLPQESDNIELIASSFDINEQVQSTAFSKHIDHLKLTVLQRHLGQMWELDASVDEAEMNAAARDRGFATAAHAAEALRPFFLRDYNRRRQVGA
ncbi:TfuA-like protein [Streptomyces sp. NPDC051907]|uniref:TfuA-like protein n=1 Tax=Streptomyces sp. NPDC051907 TaxID=3155284 RepID=UPI003415C148